jgi:hemerythrin-like domain-containing protein
MSHPNNEASGKNGDGASGTNDGLPISALGDPLVFFSHFHKQIHDYCTNLVQLADAIIHTGIDKDVRDMAQAMVQFFDVDARLHHEDEEREFFPMLLTLNIEAAERAELASVVNVLAADHRMLSQVWWPLRRTLVSIADGTPQTIEMDVNTFVTLHRQHMNHEEAGVMPFARRYFDNNAIDQLRQALARRRSLLS